MHKCGNWLCSSPVLSFYPVTSYVKVIRSKGKTITAALEDVHPALKDVTFESAVKHCIEQLDDEISLLDASVSTEISLSSQEPMETNAEFDGVAENAYYEAQKASDSDPVSCPPFIL